MPNALIVILDIDYVLDFFTFFNTFRFSFCLISLTNLIAKFYMNKYILIIKIFKKLCKQKI